MTTSSLLDPRTPMSVPAGFPHAPIRARWIHARTPSQGTHARTHRAHARMHRAHARLLALGPHARSLARPSTLAPGPHARSLAGPISHARTGSPRPLGLRARTHRVPMPARSRGPYASTHRPMHARSHRAMHARSHRAPTPARSPCTHAPGPCAHARSGSPRPLARGVPMHACTGPMHVRSTGPMHARSHRAPMPARLWGPHARVPDPCTRACCIPCCM